MTHTPGPWDIDAHPGDTRIYAKDQEIARLPDDYMDEEEIEANANLIAGAPILLATLRTVWSYAQALNPGGAGAFYKEVEKEVTSILAKVEPTR